MMFAMKGVMVTTTINHPTEAIDLFNHVENFDLVARVAVACRTKDRIEQTQVTVAPLLGSPDIDLYWLDGSTTDAGRRLPFELCPSEQRPDDTGAASAAICEVHLGVVGGPKCAILYALQTLRQYSYELVILIENDVLLSNGWYAAMHAAIERAEAASFKVGAATVRLFSQRVLSFNDDYCLMLNSGAGCIALRPEAIDILLAHYRTLDAQELFRQVRWLTGIDASATLDIKPTQLLCVDFIFGLTQYLHGYVVAAPPTTFARAIDDSLAPRSKFAKPRGRRCVIILDTQQDPTRGKVGILCVRCLASFSDRRPEVCSGWKISQLCKKDSLCWKNDLGPRSTTMSKTTDKWMDRPM